MIAATLFGTFIACVLFSIPIAASLGFASLITLLIHNPISLQSYAQTMIRALDSFPLIAVPLFTFAGEIMGSGGISKRLINVAKIFFGRFTGGLGIISVVVCMFFAAISGTGSATVAAIGLIMIPAMVKANYDRSFSGALVAAAGTIGVIIPPSVCMVVYGVAANVSITSLFMAGIVPGIFVGLALIAYTYIHSKKMGYKGDDTRYTFKEAVRIILDAVPSLLVPVIILGGIYGGLFTPTEAAAVSAVYGIFVSVFVYKEVRIRELAQIGYHAVLLGATVLIIVCISSGFGNIITIAQIPQSVAKVALSLTTNKIVILAMINVLLLIVGTFMETNAAIIILTPILMPIINSIGVNPVHFGLLMIVNLSIGFITPPFGANLFMACQVGSIKFDDICKKILPWIAVLVVTLMFITYVPDISLWLPRVLGKLS
ncbi:TRAP transporter large permease [Anaerotruncus rubiinfantis]|uniref:TRAP transporter large permease n=1 Tax=Anaerotruncus rubiinfantis TaxID=1720200 RepID=UPI0034A584A7